jgi:RNA polymerase sigma-70 factor (ECF subfamily)
VAKDTDKELVRRVQKGDRRAFDLLFSRYQHKIHGLVSRYVRARQIDDVVQEVSSRRIARYRVFAASAFYTWLYRIGSTPKNYLVA